MLPDAVVRVEKWYLDCVTADGAGMIGYAARVGRGPLAVRCSETLVWGADTLPVRHRTVLGGALPVASPAGVQWESRAAAAQGHWRALGPGLAPVVLHEEAAGRIEWHCCCPAAQAAVVVDGARLNGAGYAERLVMTLPLARLPFRELHWGRFLAGEHACVWIRWAGGLDRTWCFHQGEPVVAEPAEADGWSWPHHRLQLETGHTLRSGRIADTVFPRSPFLRQLVPSSLGDVQETKWCSRGTLTDAQGRSHHGWAIHEVAHFP